MEALIPPRQRALCRLDEIPDGGCKGFGPAPGGFTGLFAVRQGDQVAGLREFLPAYRHAAGLAAGPLPLARRQPYRLRHPWRRIPHRRRGVRAAGRASVDDWNPSRSRSRTAPYSCRRMPACSAAREEQRKHDHARRPSRRRSGLPGPPGNRRERACHRGALPGHVRTRGARPRRLLGRAVPSHRLDASRRRRIKNTSFTGDVSIKWFEDGTLNASASCLDRHLATRGDQTAIIWESDDPAVQQARHLSRTARAGVPAGQRDEGAWASSKGDRVTIYLPMVPEAAVAMLACARIGAIHSVVFGGFSPDSLANRIQDCGVDTADHRR